MHNKLKRIHIKCIFILYEILKENTNGTANLEKRSYGYDQTSYS